MHACIGEGNGNPLQYSCMENPRYGGAWWAAVYGVGQSRTQLKRLSSSRYFWGSGGRKRWMEEEVKREKTELAIAGFTLVGCSFL